MFQAKTVIFSVALQCSHEVLHKRMTCPHFVSSPGCCFSYSISRNEFRHVITELIIKSLETRRETQLVATENMFKRKHAKFTSKIRMPKNNMHAQLAFGRHEGLDLDNLQQSCFKMSSFLGHVLVINFWSFLDSFFYTLFGHLLGPLLDTILELIPLISFVDLALEFYGWPWCDSYCWPWCYFYC